MFAVMSVNAGLNFIHRGNPENVDFRAEDLTINSMFHDMDLSSIIPENTKLVLLRVKIKSALTGKFIEFVKKGDYYHRNMSSLYTLVANKYTCGDMFVQPDENRLIEYAVTSGSSPTISVCVGGWWV